MYRLPLVALAGTFINLVAVAVPSDLKLVSPTSVVVVSKTALRVTYKLPCKNNDVTQAVLLNDDSGDNVVAVGVVYSAEERNCGQSTLKTFSERVNVTARGYSTEETTFEPVKISESYNEKLAQYVGSRLSGAGTLDRPSVEFLVNKDQNRDGDNKITLEKSSLSCLGNPSWEGNAKAVGVCLVEGNGTGAVKYKYAVIVSDDTEHPGEIRQLKVSLVSYEL